MQKLAIHSQKTIKLEPYKQWEIMVPLIWTLKLRLTERLYTSGVKNTVVAAGSPLAISYDLTKLWVTANIEETKIDDVEIGQDVDIYVDAFPNTTIKGKVEEIGLATAGTFSLLPSNNASGNYTKEVQVIPVKISIDSNLDLVPGMNVTVRIHK